MRVNEADLERLELYLDRELADGAARELGERLTTDAALADELARLRGDRSQRLSAMSVAFDGDAASVERLVASVRTARASEALQLSRRAQWLPMRSILAAAACVAFGLTLGVTLQRQHGRGGVSATSAGEVSSTGSFGGSANVSLGSKGIQGHGAYVVSLKDGNGHEVMRVRFQSADQARQFIARINSGDGATPVHVGDARILDEPY